MTSCATLPSGGGLGFRAEGLGLGFRGLYLGPTSTGTKWKPPLRLKYIL